MASLKQYFFVILCVLTISACGAKQNETTKNSSNDPTKTKVTESCPNLSGNFQNSQTKMNLSIIQNGCSSLTLKMSQATPSTWNEWLLDLMTIKMGEKEQSYTLTIDSQERTETVDERTSITSSFRWHGETLVFSRLVQFKNGTYLLQEGNFSWVGSETNLQLIFEFHTTDKTGHSEHKASLFIPVGTN